MHDLWCNCRLPQQKSQHAQPTCTEPWQEANTRHLPNLYQAAIARKRRDPRTTRSPVAALLLARVLRSAAQSELAQRCRINVISTPCRSPGEACQIPIAGDPTRAILTCRC